MREGTRSGAERAPGEGASAHARAPSPHGAGPQHGAPSPRFRRLFAALGVVSVALAVLGAILPVMPTTIFLIVAVYCFARSSPALGRKLLGARIFRPYMRYVYGERRLSGKVRFFLILWVWAGVASSMLILARRGRLAPWIVVVAVSFGILSTLGFILSGRTGAPGGLSGEARPR